MIKIFFKDHLLVTPHSKFLNRIIKIMRFLGYKIFRVSKNQAQKKILNINKIIFSLKNI